MKTRIVHGTAPGVSIVQEWEIAGPVVIPDPPVDPNPPPEPE